MCGLFLSHAVLRRWMNSIHDFIIICLMLDCRPIKSGLPRLYSLPICLVHLLGSQLSGPISAIFPGQQHMQNDHGAIHMLKINLIQADPRRIDHLLMPHLANEVLLNKR